jgi:crotonobetainyl-CoA hydratase
MALVLTGKLVSADDAMEIGLVNEVVPADELSLCVSTWADQILSCAPLAIQASLQLVNAGLDHASLASAFAANYPAVDSMLDSEDAKEGMQAFIEKRPPLWQGR